MENKKIIKVCIFDHKASPNVVTTTNGDAILDNIIIEAKTDENLITGEYYLDLIGLVDIEGLHKHLTEEAIVKVHMDYGDEYFRIAKIDKSTRDIRAFARQITISETLDMWLEDTRPTDASGQGALAILRDNSIGKKDIRVFSDITAVSTAYYQKMSMYKALHDCDQSFENRWGGEIQRRGYNLTINKKIGMDRGVQIRSRKNLTGFEAKTDIDNVCTRISAKGYDGIQAKNFIDSPLINKYSAIKTKSFKYDFVKLKNENNPDEGYNTLEEAQAELERLARLEFTEHHIDELRANYKINFVQLEYTEEYKNYVQAERIYIGDTVEVFEEKYNINIHVRAIRKKFDVLRQRVIEVELSNIDIKDKTLTTSDILSELQNVIKETDNNNVQDIIQSMINSGIKDSYVIPRQNEIIIADNKDINLAQNVVRLNKNGLAFSQDGAYGTYRYGFTINGVINASLIATGILSTVAIQNADGSLQIDLSGRDGVEFLKHGVRAIEIAGQLIKFYDWDGIGNPVGELFTGRLTKGEPNPGIVLANTKDGFLHLSYLQDDGTYNPYIIFDKYNKTGDAPFPIMVAEDICLNNYAFILDKERLNEIYTSIAKNFINKATNYWGVVSKENGNWRMKNGNGSLELFNALTANRYSLISEDETYFAGTSGKYFSVNGEKFMFWEGNRAYLYKEISKDRIWCDTGLVVNQNLHVNGDFAVSGNKNCIQNTSKYGDRLYYSIEDCESYLSDRSMHLLTVEEIKVEDNVTYERVVLLDNIFKDSVNLDLDYTIEIIKQGWGDYRVKEQTKDYFIVESDKKDFTFKYVVTAKRRGFEDERNTEVFLEEPEDCPEVNQTEYWRLYAKKAGDNFGNK